MSDDDRTASLMTPARLAQLKLRPQPAASALAWLDQLAADAGSGHIRRLIDLRGQLAGVVEEPQYTACAQAATQLATALSAIDFSLLQPRGWLARATGKGKDAASTFGAQCDAGAAAGQALAGELRKLQGAQPAQAAAIARTVAECELEVRAIQKIMDQGARWLQDMRGQLRAREAADADPAARQKLAEDTHRCELLVARLKQLRAAEGAVAPVLEQGKTFPVRAAGFVDALQQVHDTGWKDARRRLQALSAQAEEGAPAHDVEACRTAVAAIVQALRQSAGDAQALQSQQQAFAQALATLQEPLQAAA